MSVRLAVAAVIAAHAGLDEARAVGRREVVLVVARMRAGVEQRRRIRSHGRLGRGTEARDRLAHEGAQRVFVHALTSTASMMPIIAASTAAAFFPSASPAALPSITTRTFSPIPAPTESIASSVVPLG